MSSADFPFAHAGADSGAVHAGGVEGGGPEAGAVAVGSGLVFGATGGLDAICGAVTDFLQFGDHKIREQQHFFIRLQPTYHLLMLGKILAHHELFRDIRESTLDQRRVDRPIR